MVTETRPITMQKRSLLRLFEAADWRLASDPQQSRSFLSQGYSILKSLIPDSVIAVLHRYVLARVKAGNMALDDTICRGTPSAYGDPLMEELLYRLVPAVEQVSGRGVFPTYSYFRVYRRNDHLARHADRPSCEISLTVNLGYDAPAPWPIFLQSDAGPVPIALGAGDALMYRGIEREHWREPFGGEHSAQVFLHYVDRSGPWAEYKFDRRNSLRRLADLVYIAEPVD
jgi:hypothetical protein